MVKWSIVQKNYYIDVRKKGTWEHSMDFISEIHFIATFFIAKTFFEIFEKILLKNKS